MLPVIKNRNWLPNWLDDFFGDEPAAPYAGRYASPSVNIIENDKNFLIEIAAPGMTRDDFRVCVNEGDELVVSLEKCTADGSDRKNKEEHKKSETTSEHKDKKDDEKNTYLRREFFYGSFRRSFILPENVDRTKISARMKHGVLTLELPKKEESRQTPAVREISIG